FDFLLIARCNRVRMTRLIAYALFTILGLKRPRGVKEAPDQVCLNMFLAEGALVVPEEEQNLFTAHEVALARPLWAKDYLHLRFLGENPWVKKFLPNLEIPPVKIPAVTSSSLPARMVDGFWTALDWITHRLQVAYMARRRTREVVERQRILFHPIDLSREVLSAYKVRLYAITHSGAYLAGSPQATVQGVVK
ncbi:MAG: hypothetical protein Q8L46_00700, partial [candidate division WWE3 bacterium]|nr:hypothetical protein [candidate division WWE3 bacterium]